MGTCEAFAGEISQQAKLLLGVDTINTTLDGLLKKKGEFKNVSALVIVASTYNGTPPDNATEFKAFVETAEAKEGRE